MANYNSAEHIEILIKSLREYHPGFSYEILCCDNGSTDGSAEYLAALPEVQLWRLEDRPTDNAYRDRQQAVIDRYGLESYLTDYFRAKTILRDYRTTHNSALNFLVTKVTAPIFATLDTDVEFLGPNWIEPFLLPLLVDPQIGCVGSEEQSISWRMGLFQGRTLKRLHPCLSLWRTAYVWEAQQGWDVSDEFDLRFLIIQRAMKEEIPYQLTLGDTGYAVSRAVIENGHKMVTLADEDFFRSCRHFYGSTVKKVHFDNGWRAWYKQLMDDPVLKPLGEFAELSQHYANFNQEALNTCREYWKQRSPKLARQSKVPLVFVD
jgi:glycosyltransferase involved in cell wall biosynthesis